MRSQVACSKCRRSKVRCDNRGPGTQCTACKKLGRPCEYPTSDRPGLSAGPSQRRESITAAQDGPTERSGETTRKRRKIAPSSNIVKDSSSPHGELLNPHLFTSQVWEELFTIFEQHFATDLPFLHAATFTDRLRKVDVQALVDPFASLLLAFLALTTPFHETFVRHPWQWVESSSVSIQLSKKYADAARTRLNQTNAYNKPTIETTQALLMLGLHEWRCRQGQKCYLTVGSAITFAEMLGCHIQNSLDDGHEVSPDEEPDSQQTNEHQPKEERLIQEEIKRRTYWSCFILDSYLSSGKLRRQKVLLQDIKIQLPCTESAFDFGINVRTRMLNEDDNTFRTRRQRHDRERSSAHIANVANGNGVYPQKEPQGTRDDEDVEWEDEKDQEALTWFIKALNIYRGIMWYANTITRRNEKFAPWDDNSHFRQLEKKLDALKKALPQGLILNSSRTNFHIRRRTSRSYIQLHSIFALCDIALHREYLPFLPFGCSKPEGPIDGPLLQFEPDKTGYWERSARQCFKAAKEFLDLTSACKEKDALAEAPIIGFAMFYVYSTIIWCRFFPNMDQGNYLCEYGTCNDRVLAQNLDKAWAVLDHMQERLQMARFWCRYSMFYTEFLKKARREYQRLSGSPVSNNSSSTEGNDTGLKQWLRIEKRMKEFASLKDEDNDTADERKTTRGPQRELDDVSEASSPQAPKSENGETMEGTPESGSVAQSGWNSVNGNGHVKTAYVGAVKPTDKGTTTFEQGALGNAPSFTHSNYGSSFTPNMNDSTLPFQPPQSGVRNPINYSQVDISMTDPVEFPPFSQGTADWNSIAVNGFNNQPHINYFSRGNDYDGEMRHLQYMGFNPQGPYLHDTTG